MQPVQRERRLRVAMLNAADRDGGAERVVCLLRDGLRRRGHHTQLWVGRKRSREDASLTRVVPSLPEERRVGQRYAAKGFYGIGLPSSDRLCESAAFSEADVVHLHNLHGHYFSLTALPRLARRTQLVWTLHDCFPMTGGCAFPLDCERWLERCGACPQLGRYPISGEIDRTRRMLSIKRKTFRNMSVRLVTPSRHLARTVERSGMFPRGDLRIIPYGVDTTVFHPHRARARSELGLPRDATVVLLSARWLDDARKGIAAAAEALRGVDAPGLVVLLVGGGENGPIVEVLSRHEVRSMGYLADPVATARCYAAADLFVFPSSAENFPCSVQESMASGTPVLAFAIDGVTEQVIDGQTGFLVPTGDVERLGRVARRLLRDAPRLAEAGGAAAGHARREWSAWTFLDRHERLYQEMPADTTPTA